ncbi:protein kinase domain-containing protein [Dokdonella sp. MW10]|uniref:serine/threonine-protein kinase n=1 Tax=Dokdonella sp. MW10 TaxID=2992926 RepID=UPI003F7EF274
MDHADVTKRALDVFASLLDAAEAEVDVILADEPPAVAQQVRRMRAAHAGDAGVALAGHVQAALDPVAAESTEGPFHDGEAIGPYRLVREIGRGGMACVWLAERADGSLQRAVALKLPLPGYARHGFGERFGRERDILARLVHPHIARLYDAGLDAGGQPYLALEFVEGEPITRWCDTRRAGVRERLQLFGQVLDAVQFAHANLVMHRDLKPGNILVDTNGSVSLLDFGIARLLDMEGSSAAETALTRDGGRVLTLQYASPEQVRGEPLTTATDVFSLGVVLHELLAGTRPYRLASGSAAQLEHAITEGARSPLVRASSDERAAALGLRHARAMRRRLGGDLEAIVAKAMAPSPAQRYATVQAFHDDLRRHLEGHPVRARRPSRLLAAWRFVRRHAVASTVVTALVTALVASSIVAVATAQRERAQRERAEAASAFLVGVFAQAHPDENRGKPFTAAELLAKGERLLDADASRPAAVQVDLTSLIGELYWSIGDFARAEQLLVRAVDAAAAGDVPDGVRASALLRLARTELGRNAHDKAIAYAREAIDAAARAGASARGEGSQARRVVAEATIAQGSAEQALPLLHEALAADREAFGPASAEVAADWDMFGLAYKELSRYDEAIDASQRAVEGLSRVHGREHSSVVNALGVLASALGHKGDIDASIATLRESAAIAERIFGAEHRETIVQRSNLYIALNRAGRPEEAVRGNLELLAIVQRTMADTRPEQLAFLYGALASQYRSLGRFAESAQAANDAVATWTRIKGSDDQVELADPLWSLGTAQGLLGQHAEAEATLRRAIAIASRHQAPTSQWRAMYRGQLAIVLRLEGRGDAALHEVEDAIEAIGQAATRATPIPVFLQAVASEARLDTGDIAGALSTATRAVDMAREAGPASALGHRAPLFALGRALRATGRAGEAETTLREALATSRPPLGDDDPRILEIEAELAATLADLHRHEEYTALRDALAPRLRALGTPYAKTLLARLGVRPISAPST